MRLQISVSSICAQYGIAKQTVSDIRKKKDDIRKFVLKFNVEKESSVVKRMRLPLDQSLDDAVYKWFCQLQQFIFSLNNKLISNTLFF